MTRYLLPLAAALVLGTAIASPSAQAAKIKVAYMDATCANIQGEHDALIAEKGRHPSAARLAQINKRLNEIANSWDREGCNVLYGTMLRVPAVAPNSATFANPTAARVVR